MAIVLTKEFSSHFKYNFSLVKILLYTTFLTHIDIVKRTNLKYSSSWVTQCAVPPAPSTWTGTSSAWNTPATAQHHSTSLTLTPVRRGLCWNFRTVYGARNKVGIRLSYRPATLHRLAESIPWNRFLGSVNVYKFGLWRVTVWRTWFVGCGGTAVASDGIVVLLLSTVGQVQLKSHLQLSSSNDVYGRDCLVIRSSWAAASPQRPMDCPQYTSVNRSRM